VLGSEDIAGLEVAVNQPGIVDGGEGTADFDAHLEHLVGGHRPALDDVLEALAAKQFHGDVGDVADGSDLLEADDCGVPDLGRRSGFSDELLGHGRVSPQELGVGDLDGGLGPDAVAQALELDAQVDGAHSAFAEPGLQSVGAEVAGEQVGVASELEVARRGGPPWRIGHNDGTIAEMVADTRLERLRGEGLGGLWNSPV